MDRFTIRPISRMSALLAAASWASVAAPSFAQDAPATNSNEIIVTAQHRAELQEDVPMSVTAASQKTLQQAGISGVHDLDQITPGVQISYTGALTQPSVRGVTTLTSGEGFENNVAFYIDGFYQPDTAALNMNLSNISGVEIYKGPQGTLYGRNATGGAIILNTLDPSSHLTGNADVSYQRYNDIRAAGFVSGPLSDSVRVSLAGSFRNSDGYYRSIDPNGSGKTVGNAAAIRQRLIQAKIQADLSSNLTATLAYTNMTNNDPTTLLFPNQGYAPSYLPAEPFAARLPFRASSNVTTINQSISHDATLKLVLNTPLGPLTSRSGYTARKDDEQYDFDGTYLNLLTAIGQYKEHTFQQMLDYSIETIARVKATVGLSYYNDKLRNNGSEAVLGGVPFDATYVTLRDEAFAAYADGTYQVTDKLFFNVGGRYTHETKSSRYEDDSLAPGGGYLVPPGYVSKGFNNFTPRGTLRYKITPHTDVYASISRGWRSGGYNPTPPPGEPFKAENITAYEVGFKTAQSIFRFNASGFYYKYTDLQVGVTEINPINNSLISTVSNAPSARIYGLDIDGSVSPVTGLTFSAGAEFLHAHYQDFPGVTGIGLDPTSGTNIQQVQNWSGLQMVRAPNFSGNVGFNYETKVEGGKLAFSGNVFYTSSYAQSNPSVYGSLVAGPLQNAQRFRDGSYVLVNGQIGWTEPSGHATISVFVTNLSNTKYYINYGGTSYFGNVGVYNEPRSIGAKLHYTY
jgi:iron complex outermembrane receptor protein